MADGSYWLSHDAQDIDDTIDEVQEARGSKASLSARLAEIVGDFETEIGAVSALGAKNRLRNINPAGSMEIRTVPFTVNGDGSVDVGTGTVTGRNADLHINANAETGLIVGESYVLSGCPSGGSASGYRLNISGKGADTGDGLSFTYEGGQIDVYIRISSGYVVEEPVTFKPMIRRAEITDDSFQPYAPTNRELYEMVLALQSGAYSSDKPENAVMLVNAVPFISIPEIEEGITETDMMCAFWEQGGGNTATGEFNTQHTTRIRDPEHIALPLSDGGPRSIRFDAESGNTKLDYMPYFYADGSYIVPEVLEWHTYDENVAIPANATTTRFVVRFPDDRVIVPLNLTSCTAYITT